MNRLPNISTSYHPNIEQYRGRSDPEAIKAVATEMEALFAYEMIKEMRASIGSESQNNFGNDTYMSLFDMELARLFAEKGLGVQDMLLKGLSRMAPKTGESGATSPQPAVKPEQSSVPETRKEELDHPRSSPVDSVPKTQKEELDHPRSSPVDGVVSSAFGMRRHPIHGDMRFHNGVDIAAPAGTDIYPIRKGTVTFSGQKAGYGNVVVIDHGNGLITKYAHNRVNLVKAGDEVDTTTVIAQVGSTGESTGPHLHFEVRFEGKSVDPRTFFAKA